ncbi:MAG: sialidase family protein [Candidatus Acidiferrales bacterium]
MKELRLRGVRRGIVAFLIVAFLGGVSARMEKPGQEAGTLVAGGVHLWYELKADPEDPSNLILCGTKWDALTNGPYGFVYASSDSGSNWQAALEDRNSAWVTEHSCAFGSYHRAYFVSEASKVIDGEQHHDLGVTRLFVSPDAGKHWMETSKTGWADHSTSAVNSATGKLYTFFNDPSTSDSGRNRGQSVGLLTFSPDGAHVQGPFTFPGMREQNYQGVYPRNATPLDNGEVCALYYAARKTATSMEGELGLICANQSQEPSLERTVIARGAFDKDCLSFEQNALAYDRQDNRLFVVYLEGCRTPRMMLTSSDDEGRTWVKSSVVEKWGDGTMMMYPSLVASPSGVLGLLWSEWRDASGRWLFAKMQDKKLVGPPIELSEHAETLAVTSDTLWTTIHRPRGVQSDGASTSSGPAIVVGVRGLAGVVWQSSGMVAMGDKIFAIWPSVAADGMRLNLRVLDAAGSVSDDKKSAGARQTGLRDVTARSMLMYGGRQSFDQATGTLSACMELANRGNEAMRLPIKLEATDVQSPAGPISILNATNGFTGRGALWDISPSVTGDRVPPGSTTNPFCISVHVPGLARDASPLEESLLTLKMRVTAVVGGSPEQ